MNATVKQQILDTVRAYERIVIVRHVRPDGDAVGASRGLRDLLRNAFPDKKIDVVNDDMADYLAFTGPDDEPWTKEDYAGALAVCVDTGNVARLANKTALKADKVIRIDHHPDVENYADLSWVEDFRSSCCEMITDLALSFPDVLPLTKTAAEYLYMGIVTDSGRFRFKEVTGETLRMASVLLDMGLDTERLYANLYLDDVSKLRVNSYVYSRMKITEHGVASILMSKSAQEKYGLTNEAAGMTVNLLDSIRGSLIWIAFIEVDDTEHPGKTIFRVRLRSRFAAVNGLAEQYGGGGHECASGATCHSRREMTRLIADADRLLAEYKQTHDGWL